MPLSPTPRHKFDVMRRSRRSRTLSRFSTEMRTVLSPWTSSGTACARSVWTLLSRSLRRLSRCVIVCMLSLPEATLEIVRNKLNDLSQCIEFKFKIPSSIQNHYYKIFTQSVDVNENGKIEQSEFIELMAKHMKSAEEIEDETLAAFKVLFFLSYLILSPLPHLQISALRSSTSSRFDLQICTASKKTLGIWPGWERFHLRWRVAHHPHHAGRHFVWCRGGQDDGPGWCEPRRTHILQGVCKDDARRQIRAVRSLFCTLRTLGCTRSGRFSLCCFYVSFIHSNYTLVRLLSIYVCI